MPSSEINTNVGTELLFENEHVKVWQMTLAPGEESPVHTHLHDHVFVYADPSKNEAHFVESPDVFEATCTKGFVYYMEVGPDGIGPHWIKNTGENAATHFIVEMLGESKSSSPQEAETNGRWEPRALETSD